VTTSEIAGAAAQKTHVRYTILALIAGATVINYLDRTLMSVAAPALSKDLGLNAATMGIVFSAFSWSYAAAQIPGGVLLDRLGTRLTYFLSITLWSAITGLQGAVFNLGTLLAARLGVGAAEAPCFPANSRVLVTWFPQRERARANSVYSVGMYFGIAFLSPLLFWVTETFGWRVLFAIVGAIGVAYGFLWYALYRDPSEHPRVNKGELDLIEADGGYTKKIDRTPFSWGSVFWLLSKRQIAGAALGQFAVNSTLVFFLTWFPTYLSVERHMSWLSVGFFAVLPFIAASVGVLFGGQLSDFLVRRTGSVTLGRKVPIVGGLLLSSTIVSAIFLNSDALVIAVLSIAFFGQGMSNLGWTLISEVAPKNMVGLTGGVFNFFTNLAGIVTPITIGLVVQQTGSFFGGLAFISVIAMIGAFSYIFIVGKVQRIEPWTGAA
jgi:ACS family D-galactonate transporter-like MFS transporter